MSATTGRQPARRQPARLAGARGAALVLVAAVGLLLTGCASGAAPASRGAAGSSGGAAAPELRGTVTVLAAASLGDTFPALGRQFEAEHPGTTVRFSFAGSSALAQQISNGAPADVFASASTATMATLAGSGDVGQPRTFATNAAEVAVSPASSGKVRTLADLAAPGVTVALCQPEVPCGALAQQVLAGLDVHPVTRGLDVKAVLAAVTSGEVDAGLVYVTDVKAAGGKVVGVPVPAGPTTAYPIATVTASRNAALAQAFADYVLSPAARGVLTAAGFAAP